MVKSDLLLDTNTAKYSEKSLIPNFRLIFEWVNPGGWMDAHVSFVTPQLNFWMENKKPFEFPAQEDQYFFLL